MSQYDNVSVVKKANVYFDGKCVSHTVVLADGTKKTVGVILPSSLTFNTGAPVLKVRLDGRITPTVFFVPSASTTVWLTHLPSK